MVENKSDKKIILICFLFGLVLALGSYIIYDKVKNDDSKKDNNSTDTINDKNQNETKSIDNIVITNSEIKELYSYVQPSLNSNYVCLGYFYQNPFKNHTLENKISLVLINYAQKYRKKIDDNFLQKIAANDRDMIKNSSEYYVDSNVVKEGLKLIFNIDVDKFDSNKSYFWQYRSDADAFVEVMGGGDYQADIVQQLISYNELDNEVNLTVVKAELGYDKNVYRYVNNEKTLVFENNADNFKFTNENINKFPQLKYVFKKNENGKYYVSDIINLNFEEDFEKCN